MSAASGPPRAAMPHTALLLAAGLGTRMRPLTETCPKPMLEVDGRSMIDRLIDDLVAAGVTRAVVNVHWLADMMEAHVRRRSDIDILISDERACLLETGGGLVRALPLLGTDPVFVLNTDAFWHPAGPGPLLALHRAFDPAEMDECLLLAQIGRSLGYHGAGDFFLDADGRVRRRGEAASAPFAFTGVRITRPQAYFGRIEEPFSANRVWNDLLPAGRLHGIVMDADWLHVGDPEALEAATVFLRAARHRKA